MHVTFIPYGNKDCVDLLIRDMQCQKFPLPWTKGEEKGILTMAGNLRLLPFGVVDYVFPHEYLDVVLKTLEGGAHDYTYHGWKFKSAITMLRKALCLEKIPEYKKDKKLPWQIDNVNCIILGIKRDDINWKDPNGSIHEAI